MADFTPTYYTENEPFVIHYSSGDEPLDCIPFFMMHSKMQTVFEDSEAWAQDRIQWNYSETPNAYNNLNDDPVLSQFEFTLYIYDEYDEPTVIATAQFKECDPLLFPETLETEEETEVDPASHYMTPEIATGLFLSGLTIFAIAGIFRWVRGIS